MVFGLLFANPLVLLLGQIVGSASALVIHRRQRPVKLAFNIRQLALQTIVAVAVFQAINNPATGLDVATVGASVFAMIAALFVGHFAISGGHSCVRRTGVDSRDWSGVRRLVHGHGRCRNPGDRGGGSGDIHSSGVVDWVRTSRLRLYRLPGLRGANKRQGTGCCAIRRGNRVASQSTNRQSGCRGGRKGPRPCQIRGCNSDRVFKE